MLRYCSALEKYLQLGKLPGKLLESEQWTILAQCAIKASLNIAISGVMSELHMLAYGHVKIAGRHLTGKITSTTIRGPVHSAQQGFDHQHKVEVEIWRTSKGGSREVQH